MALHDALTGLPIRRLIDDRLDMALRTARRAEQKFALLFVDLNGFKSVGVSIGVAVFPDDGESAEALEIKADQAMYYIKQQAGIAQRKMSQVPNQYV